MPRVAGGGSVRNEPIEKASDDEIRAEKNDSSEFSRQPEIERRRGGGRAVDEEERNDRPRLEGHRHRRNASWPAFVLIFFSYTRRVLFFLLFPSSRISACPSPLGPSVPLSSISRESARPKANVSQPRASRQPGQCALAWVDFSRPRRSGKATDTKCRPGLL